MTPGRVTSGNKELGKRKQLKPETNVKFLYPKSSQLHLTELDMCDLATDAYLFYFTFGNLRLWLFLNLIYFPGPRSCIGKT